MLILLLIYMGLLHDRKSLPELERDGMGETILMIFYFYWEFCSILRG
jgi:hypothetical protein